MVPAVLVCVGVPGCRSGPPPLSGRRARRVTWPSTTRQVPRSGRGADAHVADGTLVRGAWSGLERLKHLAIAVLTDPAHATRPRPAGPGRVPRPVAIARGDSRQARSRRKRRAPPWPSTTPGEPAWAIPPTLTGSMAMWCEQHGLKPEATAHLTMVTQLDPRREAAWKRLGYKKQGGALGHRRTTGRREGRG